MLLEACMSLRVVRYRIRRFLLFRRGTNPLNPKSLQGTFNMSAGNMPRSFYRTLNPKPQTLNRIIASAYDPSLAAT